MKRAIYFLFAIGLTISQSSCTYEPPLVCDCAANNIREKTSKFNQELNNKCDKHFQSLSENEKQRWLKEIKACMNKDPYYQKILAEEKKKYYQSPEYLYGTWVCVMNGIGMRTKIMR
nr:hypothetical protein [Bacteroidota bacterium]